MRRLVVGLTAVAVAIFCQTAFSAVYTVTDLGLGSQYPVINNGQQIAGGTRQRIGQLWENGVITSLGTLPGSNSSVPQDINDAGQIVGGHNEAWLWENGVMNDLGTLEGNIAASANGINNIGQIVGYSYGGTRIEEAFIWKNGTMTGLGALGGDRSRAYAINDSGQVTGFYVTRSEELGRPFIWENGTMRDLGTIVPVLGAYALDINNAGLVVGQGPTTAGNPHAILWDHGNIVDLGVLAGYPRSYASAINDQGQIVGQSYGIGLESATLWQDDRIFELNDLIKYAHTH
jgi:probable HAF family extracellular repeat protein